MKTASNFFLSLLIIGFFYITPPPVLATPPCPIVGDTNNCDEIVNIFDFTYLNIHFGTNQTKADLNGDNIVNILDFSIISKHFGKTIPTDTPTSTIILNPTNTMTPSQRPTTIPTTVQTRTDTFPKTKLAALGTCSEQIHDQYSTVGPDGNTYRTWHPIQDPSGCIFAHEHGDQPHPQATIPPFGYISKQNGSIGMIAAHAGYKCFTHYENGNSGFNKPELDYRGVEFDHTVCIHQGTAGAGRLSVRFHDFWFWGEHQNKETIVTAMADTGSAQSLLGSSEINGEPGVPPGRFISSDQQPAYEQWEFLVRINNQNGLAWTSNQALFAVTNTVTYLTGGTVTGSLAANCQTQIADTIPCTVSDLTGHNSNGTEHFFLGNMRAIHEPDWQWLNTNGPTEFCTDVRGNYVDNCNQPNTIKQIVAQSNLDNTNAALMDRTPNAQGFNAQQASLWEVGVPGGN